MKRKADAPGSVPSNPKKTRDEVAVDSTVPDGSLTGLDDQTFAGGVEMESLKELEEVQSKLMELDNECVREQLKIQRKFAARMRPFMTDRQAIVEKIPNFWGRVISNLPLGDNVLCEEDGEILPELELVDLDDNIDERGSYKLTFRFSEKTKEYFSPQTIEKTVIFEEKNTEEPVVTATKIEWVPGKNIVEKVRARRARRDEDDEAEIECSIFEWFEEEASPDCIPLGEVIRRQVWQNPLLYLYDGFGEDDDSKDDEDEDLDDEDAVEGVDEEDCDVEENA